MKTCILLITAILALASTTAATAQKTWLGVDGGTVLPTGDLSDVTKSGGGGGIHFDFALSQSFQFRTDISWLQFSSKKLTNGDTSKARVIPARLGLVWVLGPLDGTLFTLGAMGGAYSRRVTTTRAGNSTGADDIYFGASIAAGMLIPAGPNGQQIELNVSYDKWFNETSPDGKDLDQGLVRMGVGFRFHI